MAQRPKLAHVDSDTHERLLEVAFDLFGRHGYEGVSIDQISRACNLSKGALYWYFDSKEDLFISCLSRLRALLDRMIYQPMLKATDPREQLVAFFHGLREVLLEQKNVESIAGLLLSVGDPGREKFWKYRQSFRHKTESFFADIIRQGRDQNLFHFEDDPQSLARAMSAMLEGCILQTRREQSEYGLEVLGTLCRALFITLGAEPPNPPEKHLQH